MAFNSGPNKIPTFMEMAWASPHIAMGSGYSIWARELRAPALEKFTAQPDANSGRKVEPESYRIETQSELDRAIQSSVSASAPIEGVEVSVSASYMNKAKASKTDMTSIIKETIEDPPRHGEGPFTLTPQAQALLETNPKDFTDTYGEYFVYGCRSRSTFVAFCEHHASSEETLNELKSSLSLGKEDVAEASAELETKIKETKSYISTSVMIKVEGYGGKDDFANTKEIESSFKKFQENAAPTPYVALLQHYSTIDPRITTPGKAFVDSSPLLTQAYRRIFMLQSRVNSSPMVEITKLADKVSDHANVLSQDISPNKATFAADLDKWTKQLDVYQAEYDVWALRYRLLGDYKKVLEPRWGNDWVDGGVTPFWARGLMIDSNHNIFGSLAGDVIRTSVHWNPAWIIGTQYQGYTMGQIDKLIIGVRITSNWTDGSNGAWRLVRGYPGDSELQLEFHTAETRGANWTAEIWSVDKALYETSF